MRYSVSTYSPLYFLGIAFLTTALYELRRKLWDIRASHGGQLVVVWFSYGFTYVFAYFRGDFVVYKLVYFVVSPHVAFAKNVTHFCHSLRLRTAPRF